MVRILRISCVLAITFIVLTSSLTFFQMLDLFKWIYCFKLGFGILVFSLIYLLLDINRKQFIGKAAIILSISGFLMSIIPIKSVMSYPILYVSLSCYLGSFILLVRSTMIQIQKKTDLLFLSLLCIPIGILFQVKSALFYTACSFFLIAASLISQPLKTTLFNKSKI